jgi:hypothetical protein
VKAAVVVSETTDVCKTVDRAGSSAVAVRVTVVGTEAIEVVTVMTFVEVLRLVLATGLG